ncbi:MAG: flagellar basal body L-ring protein FlgH [Candidatus Krumholzibacteria bacterium]|nr:flagellar basal body L-ring protein FlgH [Candidatus Krumholzibacteria bacterium]
MNSKYMRQGCHNRIPVWTTVLICILPCLFQVTGSEAKTPLVDFETGESLVSNIKARTVGDLITIIITERATANASSKTRANNKSETRGGPALGWLDFIKPWDMEVENKYLGDGQTQRDGSLRAEISARIVEITENGNFRLEGTRLVNINGEKQLIEVTGFCRPRDIDANNTILSTYISDAQIAYNGSGIINDTSQPGVVTRVLNWLF